MKKIGILFICLLMTRIAIADNTPVLIKYADGLQNCVPGKYTIPNLFNGADSPPIINDIKKSSADQCQLVQTNILRDGKVIVLNCHLLKADLSILAQSLRDFANGKTVSSNDAVTKIYNDRCEPQRKY